MILKQLLKSISLSHFKVEKVKTLLTILGMSLGITVYVSIRLANQTIYESFEASAQFFDTGNQYMIQTDQNRIPESNINELLNVRDIERISPLSHSYLDLTTQAESQQKVHLIGIDVFQIQNLDKDTNNLSLERNDILKLLKPGFVLVSPSLWEHREKNPQLLVGTRKKNIFPLDVIESESLKKSYGENYILCDIAVYQDLLDDFGFVDQLYVTLNESASFEKVQEQVKDRSAGLYQLVDTSEKSNQSKKITEAFQLNLNFLAVISLLVSVLLVYNSISFAVLKRRKEIGTLLSIGASPKTVFKLIMLETFFVGLASSCIGFVVGFFLSVINIKIMTQTITTLYFPVSTSLEQIPLSLVFECLILGPLLALVGAFIPCLEIFRVPPRDTFGYQNFEERFEKWIPSLTIIGILLIGLGTFFANDAYLKIHVFLGFLSPAFIVLGVICCVPLAMTKLLSFIKRSFKNILGIELLLALDHIRMTLQRNTVAVASAMIAIGMFLGVSMMILSFRATVTQWIEHVTTADVFVSTPYPITGDSVGYLPQELVQDLVSNDAVKDFDWIAGTKAKLDDHEYTIMGVRYEMIARYERLILKEEMSKKDLKTVAANKDSIFVSETFSKRTGKTIGDTLTLHGVHKKIDVHIQNIFYDYSTDQGVIYLADTVFSDLFDQEKKQGVALYLKDPSSYPKLRKTIQEKYSDFNFTMRDNHSLRDEVMSIFDQTFKITHALQWIALFIAALTILNTILMLTFERTREFAVMRAIGASTFSIIKMVITESLFLGFTAVTGGIILGFALALILVFVVNQHFFAWTVYFTIPFRLVSETFFAALILSVISGLIPSLPLTKSMDSKALRYE
jgi:putative ABC transport system permease protein